MNIFKNRLWDGTVISTGAQLKDVLRSCQYTNRSEVEREIIEVTASFKSLSITVDTYVSNSGDEQQIVHLDGTIPIQYKGQGYNIPMRFWVPIHYPSHPPLVQVKPAQKMVISVGRNIDSAGMVKNSYLDSWNQGNSDLTCLIQVLCIEFSERCPVYRLRDEDEASEKGDHLSTASNTDPKTVGKGSANARSSQLETPSDENQTTTPLDTNSRDNVLCVANNLLGQTLDVFEKVQTLMDELVKTVKTLQEDESQSYDLDRIQGVLEKAKDWKEVLEKEVNERKGEAVTLKGQIDIVKTPVTQRKLYNEWTTEDVCSWFEDIGMSQCGPSLRKHKIEGKHLPSLSKDDLVQLGVTELGPRLTVDNEISKLCNSFSNIM